MRTAKIMLVGLFMAVASSVGMAGEERAVIGYVAEAEDEAFALRTHDEGVIWFLIHEDMNVENRSEIVSGNRVQVWYGPDETVERQTAKRVVRKEATEESKAPEEGETGSANDEADAQEQRLIGIVGEVREKSFELRAHDEGVQWLGISDDLGAKARSEIFTGNRIQVRYEPDGSDTPPALRIARFYAELPDETAEEMPTSE